MKPFHPPLDALNHYAFPEGWGVWIGEDQFYQYTQGKWEPLEAMEGTEGIEPENDEIKIIPVSDQYDIAFLLSPHTIVVELRHLCLGLEMEEGESTFWDRYGKLIGELENQGYALVDQDFSEEEEMIWLYSAFEKRVEDLVKELDFLARIIAE